MASSVKRFIEEDKEIDRQMASLNEEMRSGMKSKKRYPKGRMAGCNISNRRCFLLTGAGRTPTLIERYSYGSYGLPGGRTVLRCWMLETPSML